MLDLITAYEQAGAKEAEDFTSGSYCEALDEPFSRVLVDKQAARQEQQSGIRAKDAVPAGRKCHKLVVDSNERFAALSQALSALESTPSRSSIERVASANADMTDFDRSRTSQKAVLDRLQSALSASDARISALMSSVSDFQHSDPPSPAAYQRLAQALEQVQPDRNRMDSPEQKAALAAANEAVRQMKQSAERFQRLASALRQTTDDASRELIQAVSAITPLDRAMADDGQKQSFEEARQRIAPAAWKQLEAQLRRLRPDFPAGYAEAVATYRLLKDMPSANLTEEQRSLLSQGHDAEQKLAASDARLDALTKAAGAWQTDGVPGGDGPLEAWNAVKEKLSFDKPRFGPSHEEAMTVLKEADTILHASQLNPGTKGTLPMCVRPSPETPRNVSVASQASDSLRESGFKIIDDCKQAALAIGINMPGEPKVETQAVEGPMGMAHTTTALIEISARWASGTALPDVEVEGSTDSESREDRDDLARAAAIQNIVPKFTDMLTKFTGIGK